MGRKSNKKRQRAAAAAAEVERRQRDRLKRCPLDRSQFHQLVEYVAIKIDSDFHEHDRSHTISWCLAFGVDAESLGEFLDAEGLKDDWELLISGDPYDLFGPADGRLVRMPLERAQLEELIAYLTAELPETGCQHSLRLTTAWLESKKLEVPLNRTALMAQGGFCDCEVVYNVEPEGIYLPTSH